jgi:ankyrin repeat protein
MSGKQPKQKDRPGIDQYGRTELHYAARENDVPKARELIKGKVDLNARDDNGWTALHFAGQSNSVDVAELLLEAGAEVDPTDSSGNTPLSTAVFNYRGSGDLIELLREESADPYRENHHGQSPLGLARLIANYDVAKYFEDLPK